MIIHWNQMPILWKCVINRLPPWRWLKEFQRKEFTLIVALKKESVVNSATRKHSSPGLFICLPKNSLLIIETEGNPGGEQVWKKSTGGSHCLPFIRASQVGCCTHRMWSCGSDKKAVRSGRKNVMGQPWLGRKIVVGQTWLCYLSAMWLSKSHHLSEPQFIELQDLTWKVSSIFQEKLTLSGLLKPPLSYVPHQ